MKTIRLRCVCTVRIVTYYETESYRVELSLSFFKVRPDSIRVTVMYVNALMMGGSNNGAFLFMSGRSIRTVQTYE